MGTLEQHININVGKLVEKENSYKKLIKIIEPVYLARLMREAENNISQAAKMAGMNRATLRSL